MTWRIFAYNKLDTFSKNDTERATGSKDYYRTKHALSADIYRNNMLDTFSKNDTERATGSKDY